MNLFICIIKWLYTTIILLYRCKRQNWGNTILKTIILVYIYIKTTHNIYSYIIFIVLLLMHTIQA